MGRGIGSASKVVGKSAIKKIPLIGLGAGILYAGQRALAGDWAGAGLEMASGLASTVPGLGTAASIGIDAALIARDLKNQNTVETLKEGATPEAEKYYELERERPINIEQSGELPEGFEMRNGELWGPKINNQTIIHNNPHQTITVLPTDIKSNYEKANY